MATPYQERIRADGSASVSTVYGSKVPHGKVLLVKTIVASVYTTTIGDYTTAKYVFLGAEIGNSKSYLRGVDIDEEHWNVELIGEFLLKEGDRVFAEFEATATTTTYELVANGILFDEKEYCNQFTK